MTGLRLDVLVRISNSLRGATDLDGVLRTLCASLVADGGYLAAVVDAVTDGDRLIRLATAGQGGACHVLSSLPFQDPLHRAPVVVALVTGRMHICADVLANPVLAPWREQASAHGIRTLVSIPLRCGDRTLAVLTLLSDRSGRPWGGGPPAAARGIRLPRAGAAGRR